MQCQKCGFVAPSASVTACLRCNGPLDYSVEEWLGDIELGLVNEHRPGQVELGKMIAGVIKAPGHATVIAEGGCGIGKAQPLHSRIICPGQWRTMSEMEIGMPLYDHKGEVQYVTGVFPQGKKEVFRIMFNDGCYTECCDEHLWLVKDPYDRKARKPGQILSLLEIRQKGLLDKHCRKYQIPIVKPLNFDKCELPLSPYVLGVLLGDPWLEIDQDTSLGARLVHVSMYEEFILDEVNRKLPCEDTIQLIKYGKYSIVDAVWMYKRRSHTINALESLGLLERGNIERFIPYIYQWTNLCDRIALLKGLCDVAGNNNNANVELKLPSLRLVNDVCFLVQSLGGVAKSYPAVDENNLHSVVIALPKNINPFQLPQRQKEYEQMNKSFPKRSIVNIESVGKEETQCISVSGEAGLYLTDHCIVTHNTYAYLVPALQANKHRGTRTIVVTAKKNLQDQLSRKDIPYLREKMGIEGTFVNIKGKGNYLCKKQLKKQKKLFEKYDRLELWEQLMEWGEEKRPKGDLDLFPGDTSFPVDTVTAEECTGKCTYSNNNQCGYKHIRNSIKEANLIVTNHSLLGFDLRMGTGRLLEPYNILIVDEAHACVNNLRKAFAAELSETWMRKFLQRVEKEQIDTSVNGKKVTKTWEELFQSIPDERLLTPGFFNAHLLFDCQCNLSDLQRDFENYAMNRWMYSSYTALNARDSGLKRPDMTNIIEHCENHIFCKGGPNKDNDIDALYTLIKLYNKIDEVHTILDNTTITDPNYIISRVMTSHGNIKISRQPVNLAPLLKGPLSAIDKIIFTSATINNTLLKNELGITPALELTQPSPFNYKANSMIYLPKHLPKYNEERFPFAAAQEIKQLIEASKGNALVLFSAKKDLARIHSELTENYNVNIPIFVQRDDCKPSEVLRQFQQTNNSVIFGLRSFFEGIDIQGIKLCLVILVKLPFGHIDDPLCKAKKQQLGSKWWNEFYHPMMVDEVRQAAGRLIRTHLDKGVFCILDTRIWTGSNKTWNPREVGTQKKPWKGYGHQVFKALPFDNHTPRRELVIQYLRKISE